MCRCVFAVGCYCLTNNVGQGSTAECVDEVFEAFVDGPMAQWMRVYTSVALLGMETKERRYGPQQCRMVSVCAMHARRMVVFLCGISGATPSSSHGDASAYLVGLCFFFCGWDIVGYLR